MTFSRRSFLYSLCAGLGGLLAACQDLPASSPLPKITPASAASPPPIPTGRSLRAVLELKQVARLVGKDAINDTQARWQVSGTDLGSMFDKDGKLYLVFGDTFGCCIPGSGGPGSAGDWRSNTIALSTDRDPGDGLTFDAMLTDRPGHAREILSKKPGCVTVIPTNGVAVGSRMLLHYMDVKRWGDPGKWDLDGSGLAVSDDDGQTWTKDTPVKWSAGSNFGQVAFVRSAEYLYLFGIPGGRFGEVRLARVPLAQHLDPSRYEYFTGLSGKDPAWAAHENSAVQVVPAPVGELSVMWNEYLQRWIMTYLNDEKGRLEIRESPALWGPWQPPLNLVSSYPGLYGAFMHPWYVENGGETIYFTMSLWSTYAVYWMKARLERA